MSELDPWYTIENEDQFDSPTLLFYPDRIAHNVNLAIALIGDVERLRPHVKTHKTREVVLKLMEAGVTKFKCSTIAEAELLAICKAPDVLLAYPPTSAKLKRLIELIKNYPSTQFSCLFDHKDTIDLLASADVTVYTYLDLNVGMDRTGIAPGSDAIALYAYANTFSNLKVMGLHAYDGHINTENIEDRTKQYQAAFASVFQMKEHLQAKGYLNLKLIAGGSPTFANHAQLKNTECSPGTFVFWDKNYQHTVPEHAFQFAAIILTRIISMPTKHKLTIDLGHKAIASEGSLQNRAFFLNAPTLKAISHSEEHMVVEAPANHSYKIGDVIYVVPYHICPTVALYSEGQCFVEGKHVDTWKIVARDRKINS